MSIDRNNQIRGALGREVVRQLRTNAAFREHLAYLAPDGSRPVIVALIEDPMGDVFDRIGKRYPDGANVVVGGLGEHHHAANIVVVRVPDGPSEGETVDVHADCSVGIFMAYLILHRGEDVRVRPVGGGYSAALQLEGATNT